ncbi:MAG: phosphoribosylanthranilate isomerase [Acidobacteriota bacterium]|nr:phosphoribosylanthranilate isomerase [Acidobacteriota bacterium]
MMTRVKICGTTLHEDASLAVELGAAAIGFNFYEPSPRYVEPENAAEIVAKIPPLVAAVGVFADETVGSRVASIARAASVSVIQLHGPRFPKDLESLTGYRLIRAVPVGPDFDPATLQTLPLDAFLLDSLDPVRIGGTGKKIDWNLARSAAEMGKTIILAGGLTPENVGEAIRRVRPFGVDVASGVESAPGIKDRRKLRAFFAAVAEADGEH